ncbi:MAG: tetratricopeptide repeat protein, partial [Acidobacteriia bacterium]|nr:tetratricopeptide repeat protein [Terriglobia bacterium]
IDGNADFVPAADHAVPQPKPIEKMTVEEPFLRGVDEEKHGEEGASSKTNQQVLGRDPGYVPALLKMAWQAYRSADFPRAESFLARALSRNAFDPRVHYVAGVVYRAAGRWTLAEDAFWAAIHYGGPPAPALAQLGELAIRQKHYQEAADLLGRALSYAPDDALARADLAVALRGAGKLEEASKAVEAALDESPLLPFARAERWRIEAAQKHAASPNSGGGSDWAKPLPADVQNYMEVAAWYRGLDDLASADAVLESAVKSLQPPGLSPLVYYYLASDARREGNVTAADGYAAKAQSADYAKVFPNRLEDALVLQEQLQRHPVDPHGQYFLGNFLFAHGRYEDASRLWFQALGEGFENAVLMRNLGLYAQQIKGDLTGAAGFYESAVRLDPNEYRYYVDLDEIYFRLNAAARREKLFATAPAAVLNRDPVLVRRALLATQEKHFDQALELLKEHRFKPWEGGAIVRQMFVQANLQKGRQAFAGGNFGDAEKAFRQALEYPVNLGVGKPGKPRDEEAWYWLGESLAGEQKTEAAQQAWKEAAEEGKSGGGVGQLFRGLALRRLGQTEEANKILKGLTDAAAQAQPSAETLYVTGLLGIVEKRQAEARSNLQRAVQLDPAHWQARLELDQLGR